MLLLCSQKLDTILVSVSPPFRLSVSSRNRLETVCIGTSWNNSSSVFVRNNLPLLNNGPLKNLDEIVKVLSL